MATQVEIAEHIGLSERQVRNLVKSGIIPGSKGPSGYDLDLCRLSYIGYLRSVKTGQSEPEMVAGTGQGDCGSLEFEQYRLTKAKADAQELKNEKDRREVIDIQFMQFVFSRVAA